MIALLNEFEWSPSSVVPLSLWLLASVHPGKGQNDGGIRGKPQGGKQHVKVWCHNGSWCQGSGELLTCEQKGDDVSVAIEGNG